MRGYNYIVVFILFIVFQTIICAQTPILDSLKKALKNAKHDTVRCNILNTMVEAEMDDKIWPLYNEQLLKIAEKNIKSSSELKKFYLKNAATAKNNCGYLANFYGDNIKALAYYQAAYEIQKKIGHKKGMASTLYNMADIFMLQGNTSYGLEYLHKSLKIQEEIKDTFGLAYSLNNLGFIYKNHGDFPKSLEYLSNALKLRELINDKQGIANTLSNIGYLYKQLGDNEKGLDYFTRCLQLMEEINDKRGVGLSLNSIGNIYFNKRDYPKALEYYQKSYKLQEEIHDKAGSVTSLNNVALTINEIGGSNEKALHYGLLNLKLSRELGFPAEIRNAAHTLKRIYLKQHNYEKAFECYELYIQMRDSIVNTDTKKSMIKKEFQHEYEKQAAADSVKHAEEQKVKNAQLDAQAASLKQEKTQRYALYGGLILVIGFSGFVFNRFRVTQKQKKIIEDQKILVDTAYEHLHEKNKEVMDSIHYARRIQRALITSETYIERTLNKLNKRG